MIRAHLNIVFLGKGGSICSYVWFQELHLKARHMANSIFLHIFVQDWSSLIVYSRKNPPPTMEGSFQHKTLVICVPLPGKHISLVICVPLRRKHISLVICVPLPRKHIYLVIFVSLLRKHISLVIWVPLPGKHETLVVCVPLPGKHISLVLCVPLPQKHVSLVIWVPLPRKHIFLGICFSPTHVLTILSLILSLTCDL